MNGLTAQQKLMNLQDALVEDIMGMSDEEVWQEFVEDCGSEEAAMAKMRKINIAFGNIIAKAKARALQQSQKEGE
jgi:flagellar biosynthesis regulator FlaF